MKKKFCLTYWVYIPLLVVFLIPAVYLSSVAYIASFNPGDDCSFIGLFAALGIVFAVASGIITLNIVSKWLFRKKEKRIFLIPCILIDAIVCTANVLIGISLLSDGSPLLMRGIFLAVALAAAICMIVNFAELFKKAE